MANERRTRGSYSAGLATRESILETSMRLIADSGYHGFSLRDVGRSVGISHPAVIYHFPSKEALLLAVVQRYEREFGLLDIDIDEDTGAIIEKGVRPKSIGELGLAMMRLAKHPDSATIMALDCVLGVEAASPSHPAHDHFTYRFEALHSFLTAELDRLLAAGTVNFDLISSAMACALIRDWYGMAVHARYLTGEDAERHTIAGFLAACSRTLELRPEVVLTLAASIPEDLADVFARSLKIYRDMHA
jgi:Transcriptional regulator